MSKEQIEEMKVDVFNSIAWKDIDDGVAALDVDRTTENLHSKAYRKQSEGEWIEVQREWDFDPFFYIDFTCSVCGSREQNKRKFCPDCGAKMKGV